MVILFSIYDFMLSGRPKTLCQRNIWIICINYVKPGSARPMQEYEYVVNVHQHYLEMRRAPEVITLPDWIRGILIVLIRKYHSFHFSNDVLV